MRFFFYSSAPFLNGLQPFPSCLPRDCPPFNSDSPRACSWPCTFAPYVNMYAPTSSIMSLSRLQPYISGGGIVHKRTDPIIGIFIFCPPTFKLTIYQPPSSTSLFSLMHIAPPPPSLAFVLSRLACCRPTPLITVTYCIEVV